jgi:hypothetical protein
MQAQRSARAVRGLVLAFVGALLLLGWPALATGQANTSPGSIAEVTITAAEIRWAPRAAHGGLTLTVVAPDGTLLREVAAPGGGLTLTVATKNGARRIDGQYLYELRAAPLLSDATRAALATASEQEREAVVARLRRSGALPPEQIQAGAFRVAGGAFVVPSGGPEPTEALAPQKAVSDSDLPLKDQVIPDDLIVQSSLCVGFDCVDGESFGFDTLRLKENNTRIKFEDTSASPGFATNDWQLTANDSASGGLERFSIDDVTGARTPFTIIAGAPNNALFVASSGRIGLRTSAPALDVHIATTDTPALRLEQTNAGGFTAQTWDIGANESHFFVRDHTGGSRMPFRIRPGAPTSSIDIAGSGNVGIGTDTPTEKLHVNGDVLVEGVLIELSDARAKHGFTPVDGGEVLLRLRSVPISTWSYRSDASGARHMGPMAQDFFAAFGLGADDRHIAALDVNGVALAAIQELDRMMRARDERIADLERENADLEERVARLEQLVETLVKR